MGWVIRAGDFYRFTQVKRRVLPYNPKLKEYAKRNRQNMSFPEVLLWNELKNGKMLGFDFDRQRPIDQFIVDFYCKDLMLALEVDGLSHEGEVEEFNDKVRQEKLESLGVRFLRFSNQEVKSSMKFVLVEIEKWILENKDDLKGVVRE